MKKFLGVICTIVTIFAIGGQTNPSEASAPMGKNPVGCMAMRLLGANLKVSGKKLNIRDGISNYFDPSTFTIYTKTEPSSVCGIDETGNILRKEESVDEAIFQQLCTVLHSFGTGTSHDGPALDKLFVDEDMKHLWGSEENFYLITGCFLFAGEIKKDPICYNVYTIAKQFGMGIPNPIQKVFNCSYAEYSSLPAETKSRLESAIKANLEIIRTDPKLYAKK